jgi:crotonobetainyl-CoA:carnitine CoA-transferase CaiB-like acyl-CoA transferase
MALPLEGIRILDLTIWQQGPYASAFLADLGADVIKIEEIAHGDPGRGAWVSPNNGLSSYFEAHNRGKRSIALNLKDERGRDVLMRLAENADAFLNNFRIGAIERLGLTYEALSTVNPRLVYVQASGYGPRGPQSDLGAFDFLAQARSGFASTNGEPDDPPLPAMIPIGDQTGALHAAIAILAGLASRANTGHGCKFDTSLLGSMISLQAFDIDTYLFSRKLRPRQERGGSRPFWRLYRGGDGAWFIIGMLLDRCWGELVGVIKRPELLQDERFDTYIKRVGTNAKDLIAVMDDAFSAAPAQHWVEQLNAIGMFSAIVQDHEQLSQDPQVLENAYIHYVERADGAEPVPLAGIGLAHNGEPVRIRKLAPQHGEHSEEVLLEAGYTWDEISALRDAGVIGPQQHR